MPIYEYRCDACGRRSTSLLSSFSAPDPACPHCGQPKLRRLVSTFATARSGDGDGDDFGDGYDAGMDDEMGGEDFGGDEFGGGDDFGDLDDE